MRASDDGGRRWPSALTRRDLVMILLLNVFVVAAVVAVLRVLWPIYQPTTMTDIASRLAILGDATAALNAAELQTSSALHTLDLATARQADQCGDLTQQNDERRREHRDLMAAIQRCSHRHRAAWRCGGMSVVDAPEEERPDDAR